MNNKDQTLHRLQEDIQLRGLSQNTLESYTRNVRIFLEYCDRPAEQLDAEDIRNFLFKCIALLWRKWGAPHFRHSRAIHLYRGGMPLSLVWEWLGHAQLETTLIYAYADTNMKREAIEKATSKSNPLICSNVKPMWQDNESMIKRLYGLIWKYYPDFLEIKII